MFDSSRDPLDELSDMIAEPTEVVLPDESSITNILQDAIHESVVNAYGGQFNAVGLTDLLLTNLRETNEVQDLQGSTLSKEVLTQVVAETIDVKIEQESMRVHTDIPNNIKYDLPSAIYWRLVSLSKQG